MDQYHALCARLLQNYNPLISCIWRSSSYQVCPQPHLRNLRYYLSFSTDILRDIIEYSLMMMMMMLMMMTTTTTTTTTTLPKPNFTETFITSFGDDSADRQCIKKTLLI